MRDIERKSRWLIEVYGPVVERSVHKARLLQLVEYNKIVIHEIQESNNVFLQQSTDIEVVICKLMKQRLVNEDLRAKLEKHEFQGLSTEQHSLVYAMICLARRNVQILYRKCYNLTMIKTVLKEQGERCKEVLVKDLVQHQHAYVDLARKLGDVYEEMVKKA